MDILIVINNLLCGGAQKSLVSLLNSWEPDSKTKVDLLILNQNNIFFDNIPEWVNQLPQIEEINTMYLTIAQALKADIKAGLKIKQLISKAKMKIYEDTTCSAVQNIWKSWKKYVPNMKKDYDLAISYVDGFSNYYVIDKVKAQRKILWIHNEYDKLSYSATYDRTYFMKAESIVTISDVCAECLKRNFPEIRNRIFSIPNLSSSKMINDMAGNVIPEEYKGKENILVSIGRLEEQKGFDIAIDAARLMKQDELKFNWFIIGEGELRQSLESQINENGVSDCVRILNVKKNPYPYIKFADVFIQPSRYEGKSIVLDEAKILMKPIVVTKYQSVCDSIQNGITGIISEIDSGSIAENIQNLLKNKKNQEMLVKGLMEDRRNEQDEIISYMRLFYKYA